MTVIHLVNAVVDTVNEEGIVTIRVLCVCVYSPCNRESCAFACCSVLKKKCVVLRGLSILSCMVCVYIRNPDMLQKYPYVMLRLCHSLPLVVNLYRHQKWPVGSWRLGFTWHGIKRLSSYILAEHFFFSIFIGITLTHSFYNYLSVIKDNDRTWQKVILFIIWCSEN